VSKTGRVPTRQVTITFLLVLIAGFEGCASRDLPEHLPQAGLETVSATYKGRYTSGEGEHERFRAWVWAVPPDRLHVEIYGPMGGTRLVLDGGDGNLVVLVPRDRIAFAGNPADGTCRHWSAFGSLSRNWWRRSPGPSSRKAWISG
jgi:hypothetical protein